MTDVGAYTPDLFAGTKYDPDALALIREADQRVRAAEKQVRAMQAEVAHHRALRYKAADEREAAMAHLEDLERFDGEPSHACSALGDIVDRFDLALQALTRREYASARRLLEPEYVAEKAKIARGIIVKLRSWARRQAKENQMKNDPWSVIVTGPDGAEFRLSMIGACLKTPVKAVDMKMMPLPLFCDVLTTVGKARQKPADRKPGEGPRGDVGSGWSWRIEEGA